MVEPTIPAPNYTQIPNAILDCMAEMGEAELRVVMAIARQTFGWHKKRDKISLSQMEELTGMSRQGVVGGIEAGVQRGLIGKTPDEHDRRGGFYYQIRVNDVDQSSTLTRPEDNQSTSLTRSSQRTRPDLVNDVDTQKKGNKRKKESPPPTPSAPRMPIGGGGGDLEEPTETELHLLEEGFTPEKAHRFRDLDLEACRRSIKKLRGQGTQNGGIVRSWERSPPRPAQQAAQAGPAPPAWKRDDARPPTETIARLSAMLPKRQPRNQNDRPFTPDRD